MANATVRGRFVWHELYTPNRTGSQAFYGKVAGWKVQAWDQDPEYQMFAAETGPLGAAIGVDMKPAGTAKEAVAVDLEPTVKTVRFHFSEVCEEQITVSTHFRLQFATCNCGSASCAAIGC